MALSEESCALDLIRHHLLDDSAFNQVYCNSEQNCFGFVASSPSSKFNERKPSLNIAIPRPAVNNKGSGQIPAPAPEVQDSGEMNDTCMMTTTDEYMTLDLISQYLLGDFASTEAFIGNLGFCFPDDFNDFRPFSGSDKPESSTSVSDSVSPVSDLKRPDSPSRYFNLDLDFPEFESKPDIVRSTPDSSSKLQNSAGEKESAGKSGPPVNHGRNRRREMKSREVSRVKEEIF
nr:ethylene-responsive transcription factor ERF107-like [Ipomoea trifida]